MEQNDNDIKGIALLCDNQGLVKEVWRNDLGLDEKAINGKMFINLIDNESRVKGFNFIYEIRNAQVAFDYQLSIFVNDLIRVLTFVGVHLDDKILVMGTQNSEDAINFTEYLQQINNEQANSIRELLKQKSTSAVQEQSSDTAVFEEITKLNNEMANLQRQLTKKNTELERVNQLKNRFMGIAAHDLRNPLNIIQSYADFLQEEVADKLDEEQKNFLCRIIDSADYMLKLIENLLDYSQIEAGEMTLSREEFDLKQMISRVVEDNRHIANQKHIDIELASSLESCNIMADYYKIKQVMNNLISNAIKFSFPETKIVVGVEQEEDNLLIAIKDQGKGIDENNLDKIFVPFTQLEKKGTGGEKGTGLGLAIVRNIVESHEGKIWAESEVGKGAVFKLILPVSGS